MSRIILSAASRVGNVRSNNEDMVLAFDRFVRSDVYATEFMRKCSWMLSQSVYSCGWNGRS